jgi:hypothetical protein
MSRPVLISSGKTIGFALPLASGGFKAVKFSLDGAVSATGQAVTAMKTQLNKAQPNIRNAGLRDQTL